jgi:hypothetical protein
MKPKPCPFCGEKPAIHPMFPEVEGDAWGEVACTNPVCPAQPKVRDGQEVADERGTAAYQESAIKRWNHRKGG